MGVPRLLSLEARVAFRLVNRSVDELSRMVLRGGVTGMGAAIWLGMVEVCGAAMMISIIVAPGRAGEDLQIDRVVTKGKEGGMGR